MSTAFNLKYLIRIAFSLLFISSTFGQSCPTCNHTTTYGAQGGLTAATATQITNNWSPSAPTQTGIPRFPNNDRTLKRYFSWQVGGANTIRIAGLVLEETVELTIGRSNNNETPILEITGGCIVVKKNAVLSFTYFTELENLNICVEDGGSIKFDSDAQGGSDGQRDDFVFDNVVINLQGPDATLDFGNADIKLIGNDGLAINGHTGSAVCTGDPLRPPTSSGNSGNISWTDRTNICEILNFRILPVEFLYIKATHNPTARGNELTWATAKEVGNSHFIVERSINTIENWEDIAEVEGMGYTDEVSTYNYIDDNLPLVGGNIYYRLRQVDFSDKMYFSRVLNTRVSAAVSSSVWKIYPNPTTGHIKMELAQLTGYTDQKLDIKISGIQGGQIHLAGLESLNVNDQLTKFFSNTQKGIYVVQVSWGNQVEHFKIIKE